MNTLVGPCSMLFGTLPRGQVENRSAVVLDGFVAEPPVHLVTVHESLDLVLGVGVEETAANAPGQDSEHLVLITQISHHSERSRDGDAERIVETVNSHGTGFRRSRVPGENRRLLGLFKTLAPDGADENRSDGPFPTAIVAVLCPSDGPRSWAASSRPGQTVRSCFLTFCPHIVNQGEVPSRTMA